MHLQGKSEAQKERCERLEHILPAPATRSTIVVALRVRDEETGRDLNTIPQAGEKKARAHKRDHNHD